MLLKQRGVTLIELIIGIVVLGIALSLITSVLGPLYSKTIDPWHQVRAAELGQSLMNEMMSRRFDKNSFKDGSLLRCGEQGATDACSGIPTTATICNPITSRDCFIGIEDYNVYTATGDAIVDATDDNLTGLYQQYTLTVAVTNAAFDSTGLIPLQRRITITVTTPTGSSLKFTAYKGNW